MCLLFTLTDVDGRGHHLLRLRGLVDGGGTSGAGELAVARVEAEEAQERADLDARDGEDDEAVEHEVVGVGER